MAKSPIYMDYQATAPMDPRVLEAMQPYFVEKFGNPHSVNHAYGWEAEAAVELAREHVAYLIGATPSEIIFTSGATESNNMAIKGVAATYHQKKNHIITAVTEHKCILDSCHYLEKQGYKVTYLPVDQYGLIDLNALEKAITDKTFLVSLMAINNEIGVVHPLKAIGEICRKHDVLFHTDAAQAFGKIPLDVNHMYIDLMSISGHKIYGPKGVGALYVRQKPRVRITPLIHGGGQEQGLRSGTLAVPQVVGLGESANIARQQMSADHQHITKLGDYFLSSISDKLDNVTLNGDKEQRYPGTINLSFDGIRSDALILKIRDLAVSSGAACSSASHEPSYVLQALGIPKTLAKSSIRFGIGRFTTTDDIDHAISIITKAGSKRQA